MSEQQRRTVILGILGVLILGAGGWYFFLRDTGNTFDYSQQSSGQRRVRRTEDSDKPKKDRRVRRTSENTTKTVERRQREQGTRKESTRRHRRGRSGPKRVEKRKDVPRM